MKYEIEIKRDNGGSVVAESVIPLAPLPDGGERALVVYTNKRATGAQAMEITDCVFGAGAQRSFVMFQDFRSQVMTHKVSRATEKAIKAAHEAALAEIAPHIAAAKQQYGIA